jgi:hypothetical protein
MHKRAKYIELPVVTILLLTSLFVSGCGQVYEVHKYGYRIEAPQEYIFEKSENENKTLCWGVVNGQVTLDQHVSVEVSPIKGSRELNQLVMDQIDIEKISFPVNDVCDLKIYKSSEYLYIMEGRVISSGLIGWFRTDYLLLNNLLYKITYVSGDYLNNSNQRALENVHVYIDEYGRIE